MTRRRQRSLTREEAARDAIAFVILDPKASIRDKLSASKRLDWLMGVRPKNDAPDTYGAASAVRACPASKSRGRLPVVWLHAAGKTPWALLHTIRLHGGRVERVVIVEVDVPGGGGCGAPSRGCGTRRETCPPNASAG